MSASNAQARESEEWRDLLRDRNAWNAATQTLDAAEEARDYLSETIMRIDQQFADNRTMGRLPDSEWADHLDWRGAAIGFKRVCSVRKRELDRRIKQLNRERSAAEREEYLLMRARLDRTAMAEHGRFVAESIAQSIEVEAQRESDRVKWDGSPGLLGNWIGGIREGAKLARNYRTEDGNE